MELALAACLGWVITVVAFVRHLADVNDGHRLHIASLLNRIQAPREAALSDVSKDLTPGPDAVPVEGPDADAAYWAYKKGQ